MRLVATDKLRERRKETKTTQEKFVEVIKCYNPKVTRKAYESYETGRRSIDIELAKTIAALLNRPLYKLFKPKE